MVNNHRKWLISIFQFPAGAAQSLNVAKNAAMVK
jgi:hypothetical protein